MIGNWKINTVAGHAINHEGQFGKMIGNFIVDEDKVNFRYGNSHFGQITVNGDKVQIGPLASTRMFVPIQPPEHQVSRAIESATKFKLEGSNLTLLDEHGNTVAQLTKV